MHERDFDNNPYTPDEQRVASFFYSKGTGGGDDPIGFLMVGYDYVIAQRNALIIKNEKLMEIAKLGHEIIKNLLTDSQLDVTLKGHDKSIRNLIPRAEAALKDNPNERE